MNRLKQLLRTSKFIALIFGCSLLVICWFITAHWTSLSPNLAIVKDGIVTMIVAYLTAHSLSDLGHHGIDRYIQPPVDQNTEPKTTNTDQSA